jgi:hypothetical protein
MRRGGNPKLSTSRMRFQKVCACAPRKFKPIRSFAKIARQGADEAA